MDAMLVRQYNLIQCFSNPKAKGNELAHDDSTVGEHAHLGGGGLTRATSWHTVNPCSEHDRVPLQWAGAPTNLELDS